jgi:hypothetical protein
MLGVLVAASFLARRAQTQDQSYPGPVQRIELNLGSGDAVVRATSGAGVSVHRHLVWSFARPKIHETLTGQTLTITTNCSGIQFGSGCGVDYTIGVPPGVTLVAKSSTGDVKVSGVQGPVDVRTSTGDVDLTGTSGDLTVHTSSGDVTGTGLTSPHINARVSTADVALTFTKAPDLVDARSSTGDVRVTVPDGDAYKVDISTSTGDRTVRVSESAGSTRSITVHTSTGDVTVNYG